MGINLCGGNAFMSQHFLHGTQVRPALYQVRSKRMTESMGADVLFDTRLLSGFFDNQENHHPGEFLASAIEKDKFLVSFGRSLMDSNLLLVDFEVA